MPSDDRQLKSCLLSIKQTGRQIDPPIVAVRLQWRLQTTTPRFAFAESFIGRPKDECLNEHLFRGPRHARELIAAWQDHYNHRLPHTSLQGLTSVEFANRDRSGP
jgi:transposase InsO family protein